MSMHTDRQTRVMCIQTWLTGTPHSSQYSTSILGQTNNHSNILSYCMISTVISSNLINNYSFKLQFNHIIFYHLESFYCSLNCGRQLHSRQKNCIWQKVGGSEAGKPWTLKSGGLEPRSLTQVYAYAHHSEHYNINEIKHAEAANWQQVNWKKSKNII